MSFRGYVTSKNIYDDREILKPGVKDFKEGILTEHIDILYDLHNRLKGCPIPTSNMTNKMVEDFKISKIFLERDLLKYKTSYCNKFEYNIRRFGDIMLQRIEKILDIIECNNYDDIVLRSLKSKEISIYNACLHQIYMDSDLKIYVKNIDEFCENIVEYDYIKFLTKIKRMGKKIDFMKTCAYICGKEKLDIDSYNFILACVSFPYEFVRVVSKYRDLGGYLSSYSDVVDFDVVIRKDGESLV